MFVCWIRCRRLRWLGVVREAAEVTPCSKLERMMGNFLLLLLHQVLHSFVLPVEYLEEDVCCHNALCFRIKQT